MSVQYDNYLVQHKANVKKGYYWLKENLPELFYSNCDYDLEQQIGTMHDYSKTDVSEYYAYDEYFYGNNRSYQVVQDFNEAWLHHIHRNPHHWQYWVLIKDEADEGLVTIQMPYNYVIEMICDWWAFSWNKGNLTEIFDWYDNHKDYMKLHHDTRKTVESILGKIKNKLDSDKEN